VREAFFHRELSNGLVVLGQRMEGVSSAAMTFVLPAGSSHDPPGAAGAAAVGSEWCLRGAGERDTRALNDALDALGCQHDETVLSEHVQFSAAALGRNLPEVLAIYADIVRRPRLEDASFEACRALAQQDLAALEDEPARKCTVLLRERFYPSPLGRCSLGDERSLASLTAEKVRLHLRAGLAPRGAMLAVAGAFDWAEVSDLVERHFGDWSASGAPPPRTAPPAGGVTHVAKDSAQVHIALAHRTVPAGDARYYAARMAETVLSGGMSARLFTEVREKRGLVYHVSCRYHSLKAHAGMFTYAGTTAERAQQTLEVTVAELRRLGEGIDPDELARGKTQLKSALIMQGESTSARAGALAGDWYHLGRLRSLEEIAAAIDALRVEDVLEQVRAFPARGMAGLVVGPEALDAACLAE